MRLLLSLVLSGVLATSMAQAKDTGKKSAEEAQTKKTKTLKAKTKEKSAKGKAGKMTQAPDTFKAVMDTTKGKIVFEVNRSWSPKGVDRFYELIEEGFFKDIAMFRAVKGFVVQFGIHGDPKVSSQWKQKNIDDDPVKESNEPGTLTFATAGPNTRTTQLFINLGNNARLDQMGFSPFAKVVEGMDVLQKINTEYGESPDQGRIQAEGNSYLKKSFPNLDYIKSVSVVK
jgi:peptidyl-prolyl cis-trans isomerase A (cyclophilin A)